MKIGRNKPCPCGSGKKYKNCCLYKDNYNNSTYSITEVTPTPEIIALREKTHKENTQRMKMFESIGIYIDFVKPVLFKGKKFWALGNRIYYNRPPNETFHEFIISILHQTVGDDWIKKQHTLSEENQHFIFRCFQKYKEWLKNNCISKNRINGLWAAQPDGWTLALLSLAFDISILIHKEHIPEQLLNRLKNKDHYQGARYEIATSSLFGRMGYKIDFLDEKNINTTHPEFIAENRITGEKVAVEVKSKHREGVLHQNGTTTEPEHLLWGDIQRLFRQALKQNPGNMSFIIFIDLNAPSSPEIIWEKKPWLKDIKKMLDKAPQYDEYNTDPCNAIIFTNYSYHYQTENEAKSGEYLLTSSLYPTYTIKDLDFFKKLGKALRSYGNIPNLDIEIGL